LGGPRKKGSRKKTKQGSQTNRVKSVTKAAFVQRKKRRGGPKERIEAKGHLRTYTVEKKEEKRGRSS